ncbi:MAG: type IV toxin-antitoxin system AbiEi family antitoxin domain-containing protein [Pseudonocardia sp.]|nr:type IV toxin-antitoxin system AbiEi family antitoxin domain-containing protein [Pseudonocardia sp.]
MTLENVLARQAGVISRAQALATGLSREAVDYRVKARRWRPLYPGVYLVDDGGHSAGRDDEVRVRAALLWAGADAFLCGRAAAWWYGMVDEPPPTVGVSVGRLRRLRRRPGVDVVRRELAPEDRHRHRGIAVTAPALTVLEAAVALGQDGPALLDGARRSAVPFADLHAAHGRYAGSAGSAAAARLLHRAAERSADDARRALRALLRGAGACGWTDTLLVDEQPVDAAFPAARVAVLASGWAEPVDRSSTEAVARRWTALIEQGWTIVHVPWRDLVEQPHGVLNDIARHVVRGPRALDRAG